MIDTLSIVLILLGRMLEFPSTYKYYCNLIQNMTGGNATCDNTAGSVVTVVSVLCILALVIVIYNALNKENM
jgi:hypothetical protein